MMLKTELSTPIAVRVAKINWRKNAFQLSLRLCFSVVLLTKLCRHAFWDCKLKIRLLYKVER